MIVICYLLPLCVHKSSFSWLKDQRMIMNLSQFCLIILVLIGELCHDRSSKSMVSGGYILANKARIRMEIYSHILNWCGRIFVKCHTLNRECRIKCSYILLVYPFNNEMIWFVILMHQKPFLSLKKHHYFNCMVITKLWKDIHPKPIRVENNSIYCKNIAPWLTNIE